MNKAKQVGWPNYLWCIHMYHNTENGMWSINWFVAGYSYWLISRWPSLRWFCWSSAHSYSQRCDLKLLKTRTQDRGQSRAQWTPHYRYPLLYFPHLCLHKIHHGRHLNVYVNLFWKAILLKYVYFLFIIDLIDSKAAFLNPFFFVDRFDRLSNYLENTVTSSTCSPSLAWLWRILL